MSTPFARAFHLLEDLWLKVELMESELGVHERIVDTCYSREVVSAI
jgi:hypothetical protein